MINEITKDIAPGIIIEEGQLIQLPSGRLVKDFFQAVAMPETMGVMAGIEAPLRRRWGRCLALVHGALHPLDSRGTDLQLGDVLEFPGQAFRAKPRLHLDEAAGLLLHLARQAPGGQTGRRPFGPARQLVAVPQALDRAGRRRLRTGVALDLRRAPGRMALGQSHQRRLSLGGETIRGALGAWTVIRQGPLQRVERPVAPLL